MRLTGALDLAALNHSFSVLIERHEILRTAIYMQKDQPRQAILPQRPVELTVEQLSDSTPQDEQLEAVGSEIADDLFDLTQGYLWRIKLVRIEPDHHVLFLVLHHIVADGWSTGVLIRELSALYAAQVIGHEAVLPALPIRYVDFASWQRQWLQRGKLRHEIAYWRQQLHDAPTLNLPTDYPRPKVQSAEGDQYSFFFSAKIAQNLHAFSQQTNTTPFMVLLTGLNVLLYRLTGQQDIVIGAPIANRIRDEIEPLIGFFVNTLALRAQWSGDLSFLELLEHVRETCLNAYAHQDVPFEKLVAELQPNRDLARQPLFQVMLAVQNMTVAELQLPGLTLTPYTLPGQTSKFDVTLFVDEHQGALQGVFEYSTALFDHRTIVRFAEYLQTILQGAFDDPEQKILALPILGQDELHQLLYQWNTTDVPLPDATFCQLFETQAHRSPAAIAVADDNEHLTYAQLDGRANAVAHYLHQAGIRPDDVVGLFVDRSVTMLVAVLGVLKAGAAYLPLDPMYPTERLAYMLDHARAALILTQPILARSITSASCQGR